MKVNFCKDCKYFIPESNVCFRSPLIDKTISLIQECGVKEIKCRHKNVIATKDVRFKTDDSVYDSNLIVIIVCNDCGKVLNVYTKEDKECMIF